MLIYVQVLKLKTLKTESKLNYWTSESSVNAQKNNNHRLNPSRLPAIGMYRNR